MSPTPVLSSEKAVLALHDKRLKFFLRFNSAACFDKSYMEDSNCSSYCQHEIQNFTRCDFVNRLKLLSNIPNLDYSKKRSSQINKAFEILTSIPETKHLSTSAEFKIRSNFIKLSSKILGWLTLFFLLFNKSHTKVDFCKFQPHSVKSCIVVLYSRTIPTKDVMMRLLLQPLSGSKQGYTAHDSLVSSLLLC